MAVSAFAALVSTVSYTAATGFAFAGFQAFAVKFALGAALRALTPKPSISGANRGYQVNSTGSALDHQIIYGKVRVGGAIVYDESTGDTNEYLHRIIAVAGHEIQSFDRIYIDDEYIDVADIESDGNVPLVYSSDGSTTSNKYNGKLRINLHLGASDQAADSDLVSESDGLWTSAHRLRGIAYMYVRLRYNADTYPNGIPTFTATVKGKKVYNPSTGLTTWSDNPALCLRDYLTSTYGLSESATNIDDTLTNTAVGICNQTNTNAGTTRYTCNGSFTTASTPYDIINNLLTSMGGTLWYAQGKWRMKPAYWTAPVLDLDANDLRSSIGISTRHSRRDNFNVVKGTFRGEETNWQVTDYPQVDSAAFLAADNGQESVADVDLPFTDNSVEARRLARIALESNRQQLTITASFGLRAMKVQVGDNIRFTNPRYGWDNKEFEVLSWGFGLTDELDLQVSMVLRETAQSVFDEVDDGAVYERDNTVLPDPFAGLAVANLSAQDSGRLQSDGTFVNAVILNWTAASNSFVSHYEVEWKPTSGSTYSSTTSTTNSIEISPVVDSVQYTFRVRAVSFSGNGGSFASITHTAGGDTTSPSAPTGVNADGGFKYVTVSWTNPADLDLNYVEVYENTSNSSAGASLVGTSSGDNFVRTNLGLDETYWYFLKAVDYSGNKSGFTSGVSATTTYLDDPDFANGVYSLFTEQGLYAIEDVTSLPASGDFVGHKVFNRTDGKLYQWTGSAWEQVVGGAESFGDLQGSIAQSQIPNGVIDTAQIADDAIEAGKISANAVGANAIAANSIYGAAIQGGVITGDKITANTITGGLLATSGIITNSAQITDAVISSAKIQDLAVDTIKIADQAVSNTGIDESTGTPTSSLWVQMGSLTLSTDGGNPCIVQVGGIATLGGGGESGPSVVDMRLLRNGSQIAYYPRFAFGETLTYVLPSVVLEDTTSSGSTTYVTQVRKGSGSGVGSASIAGVLIATELKK